MSRDPTRFLKTQRNRYRVCTCTYLVLCSALQNQSWRLCSPSLHLSPLLILHEVHCTHYLSIFNISFPDVMAPSFPDKANLNYRRSRNHGFHSCLTEGWRWQGVLLKWCHENSTHGISVLPEGKTVSSLFKQRCSVGWRKKSYTPLAAVLGVQVVCKDTQ